jgi:sugar transferase (PEP-CTERM system associated)
MAKPYDFKKQVVLFVGDVVLIILSTSLSITLRFAGQMEVFKQYGWSMVLIVLLFFISLYVFDLYNLGLNVKGISYLVQYSFAISAGAMLMAFTFYLFPFWIGRGIFIIDISIIFVSDYLWRLLFNIFFASVKKQKAIAIVGAGWAGKAIRDILQIHKDFDIIGFVDDDAAKWNQKIDGHTVLGGSSLLADMAKEGELNSVVVAITHEKSSELLSNLLQAKMNGLEVYDMPTLYEDLTGKLPVYHLRKDWLVFTSFYGMKTNLYMTRIKRLVDLVCSFAGLVILSPVAFLAVCAIKVDSPGPALFRQKRVGHNGVPYQLLKFRSMAIDAETNGAVWAQENDTRVTRVGKIIRKTRLDEVPQMWNVLKGEMSFVGPRPERPEFVAHLKDEIPFYSVRHSVKPGITGWAQVNYQYGASQEDAFEKLQYDLFYIKNLSIFLDLQVLLKTVKVVLFTKGAR